MTRTILHGDEHMTLHDNGNIQRHGSSSFGPSGQWRVTGAVTYDNFGHVIEFYSLQQILDKPDAIPWQHKNGKQKTFIRDYDHGSTREWRNPKHKVF